MAECRMAVALWPYRVRVLVPQIEQDDGRPWDLGPWDGRSRRPMWLEWLAMLAPLHLAPPWALLGPALGSWVCFGLPVKAAKCQMAAPRALPSARRRRRQSGGADDGTRTRKNRRHKAA